MSAHKRSLERSLRILPVPALLAALWGCRDPNVPLSCPGMIDPVVIEHPQDAVVAPGDWVTFTATMEGASGLRSPAWWFSKPGIVGDFQLTFESGLEVIFGFPPASAPNQFVHQLDVHVADSLDDYTFRFRALPGPDGLRERCGTFVATREARLTVTPVVPPPPGSGVITWTGDAGTEDWLTASNWDLDRVPEQGDSVVIGAAAVIRFDPVDLAAADIDIRHLALAGELEVVDGGILVIDEGIAGDGTLRVEGSAAGVRTFSRVTVGADSELAWLQLAGSGSLSGEPVPNPLDNQPTVTANLLDVDEVVGSTRPSLLYVHLVVHGGSVTGNLDTGTSTLEIADQATLLWDGTNVRFGPAGSPSGRVVVRGELQVSTFSATINSAVWNYGTISAARALVMEYGGINEGVIVAQDVDQGQLTFLGQSTTSPRDWDFRASSEVTSRRITLTTNARVDGLVTGARLQVMGGTPMRLDTIRAEALAVDTLVVSARVWIMGSDALSMTRTFVSNAGAELWLVEDPAPPAPLVLQTRRLMLGAGALVGGAAFDADSLLLGPGLGMVLAGNLRVGTYGSMTNGQLQGRGGSLDVAGQLDLNPGASNSIEIVTEAPTVGADLTILNNGVIRKRGAGTALLRGCFDPSGTGSIVTDAGANPPTIVSLTCP